MNSRKLFDDDRAVSPVIGVILMVAITVILAAVIGTFVLGLGESVQSAPQAGVSSQQQGSAGVGSAEVTLTMVSEGNIDVSTVSVNAPSCAVGTSGSLTSIGNTSTVDIGSGSTCTGGEMITVTAETPSGSSGVISQYTIE